MKRHLRLIVFIGCLVIAAQYWMLADLSHWLIVDSYAAEHFPKKHPIWSIPVVYIWGADLFGGRYLVILILAILCWWFVRPPRKS